MLRNVLAASWIAGAALALTWMVMACSGGEETAKEGAASAPKNEGAPAPGAQDAATTKTFIETASGLDMKMIWISGGTFEMGSHESLSDIARNGHGSNTDFSPMFEAFYKGEFPLHSVTLDGFWLGETEVTQAQYEAIMRTNPSKFKGSDLPVEEVSWEDAMGFCRKLSASTGRKYSLPTEAQWEYACRAGTKTAFSTGATISTDQANYKGYYVYANGSKGKYRGQTTAVKTFSANAWGLYNMHGNVMEWCADWSGDYESGRQANPMGPSSGEGRVLRGGSWALDPVYCRSAYRNRTEPSDRAGHIGFRVCLVARTAKEGAGSVPKKEGAKAPGEQDAATTKTFIETASGLDMKMIWIPYEMFEMGSRESASELAKKIGSKEEYFFKEESPCHFVILDGFWMGETEVTVGQFRQFVNDAKYLTHGEKNQFP